MSKFKEITRDEKIQKIWFKPTSFLLHTIIIDNISLSYNLVEQQHVSPILQKETIEIVIKGPSMLKIQSLKILPKKLPIFIAKIS
jgi:hypothetical protein